MSNTRRFSGWKIWIFLERKTGKIETPAFSAEPRQAKRRKINICIIEKKYRNLRAENRKTKRKWINRAYYKSTQRFHCRKCLLTESQGKRSKGTASMVSLAAIQK